MITRKERSSIHILILRRRHKSIKMAKTISFSVVKILPALLSGEKRQTIRPAWKIIKKQLPYDGEGYSEGQIDLESNKIISKPPRFKVGEPVKLYWKQRTRYLCFCRNCGNGKSSLMKEDMYPCEHCKSRRSFEKILGESEITEVKKVKMGYMNDEEGKSIPFVDFEQGGFKNQDLARRDGFKDVHEMFKFFDGYYDLSIIREFYVYRWLNTQNQNKENEVGK